MSGGYRTTGDIDRTGRPAGQPVVRSLEYKSDRENSTGSGHLEGAGRLEPGRPVLSEIR